MFLDKNMTTGAVANEKGEQNDEGRVEASG